MESLQNARNVRFSSLDELIIDVVVYALCS